MTTMQSPSKKLRDLNIYEMPRNRITKNCNVVFVGKHCFVYSPKLKKVCIK